MVPGEDRTQQQVTPSHPRQSWVPWPQPVLEAAQLGHAPVVDDLGAPPRFSPISFDGLCALACVLSVLQNYYMSHSSD